MSTPWRLLIGADQLDARNLPESRQPGVRTVGGAEQDVGVKEDDRHRSVVTLVDVRGLDVRNRVWVEPQGTDLLDSSRLVIGIDRVLIQGNWSRSLN